MNPRHLGILLTTLLLAQTLRAQSAPDAPSPASWADLLERYVAWDESGRGRHEPWDGAKLPTPQESDFLYANPPRDPRQALGVALLAMSGHRHPEMRAILEHASKRPSAPARVHALLACFLVAEGRYRKALAQLDAAEPDDTCGLTMMPMHPFPLRQMRAIALHGLGRRAEARALLQADAPSATTLPVLRDACLIGDLAELDGDLTSAETMWRLGECDDRLNELRARTEPFEVLRGGWSGYFQRATPSLAVASANLGDPDGAAAELERESSVCAQPPYWTPDCLRLPLVRARLAPMLARAAPTSALRSIAPFEERTPVGLRLAPFSAEADEPQLVDAPPPALAGWYIVRLETRGRRVIAVSAERADASPTRDGFPLYRLHVSRDGGERFEPPIVLGLEPGCPCVVRSRSTIPMLDGATLQLEATCVPGRAELDTMRPVLLVASLAALTRDRDEDGLTDVQEQAWRLDPARADTDGDTVPDGRDASPRIPPGWEGPEINSFLEWLASTAADGAWDVPASELPGHASRPLPTRAAPSRQEPLELFAVQSLAIGGVRPPTGALPTVGPRVIALTESESGECGEDVWETRPLAAFRLRIVFDLDRSRALVSLSTRDGGSAWVAVRDGEKWSRHGIVMWVQ